MPVVMPEVRIGDSLRCGGLTMFPLFGGMPLFNDGGGTADYAVAHEAMQQGAVTVREVSEAGSVCELLAENFGDRQVLFVEGEELRAQSRTGCWRHPFCLVQGARRKSPCTAPSMGGGLGQDVISSQAHIARRHFAISSWRDEGTPYYSGLPIAPAKSAFGVKFATSILCWIFYQRPTTWRL